MVGHDARELGRQLHRTLVVSNKNIQVRGARSYVIIKNYWGAQCTEHRIGALYDP
jgi:hypothetical protein